VDVVSTAGDDSAAAGSTGGSAGGVSVAFKEDLQGALELIASIEMYLAFNRLGASDFRPEDREKQVVASFHSLLSLVTPPLRRQQQQQPSGQRQSSGTW
jgi:hypothetical protein